MKLTKNDLSQIDDDYLTKLKSDQLLALSKKLLSDVKVLHDRLGQNSTNSSRPPSLEEPWISAKPGNTTPLNSDEDDSLVDIGDPEEASPHEATNEPSGQHSSEKVDTKKAERSSDGTIEAPPPNDNSSRNKKRPGKQIGTPGIGRTQKLPITEVTYHRAVCCNGCSSAICNSAPFEPKTGHYVIDIRGDNTNGESGIVLINTKHVYGDTICPTCQHRTRIFPARCEAEEGWKVELTEWHLVGPRLVSLICCLAMRMRLSRQKIQEFLWDWVGLSLSTGTINQCIHETGRAVAPLEEELQKLVEKAELLNVDETSWKEAGKTLWLWVFVSTFVVYFTIGSRSAVVLEKVLGSFSGWFMSDGYQAYRRLLKRLRCWAHLKRKATGVSESLTKEAKDFGQKVLTIIEQLEQAVYKAREGPSRDISNENKPLTLELYMLCLMHEDSEHEKTRALAREFLNDWAAIFMILKHPEMPLTNNEAEQSLRHWVIARRISYGTRTHEGSTAFVLLASVIETCRKRNVTPWAYIASVVRERRKGHMAPCLPQPA